MFHHWGFAVFLLCFPVLLNGRPINALGNRIQRSVSHLQLMHDKGHSLQEFKRRLWLQELLDEVHTADEHISSPQNRATSHAFSGIALHPKSSRGAKNLPVFGLDKQGATLPQETNKSVVYKHPPLKTATKRKKKVRSGRRRESEKRRRKTRSVMTQESQRTGDLG